MKHPVILLFIALLIPSCGYVLESDLLSPLDVGGQLVQQWNFDNDAAYSYDVGITVAGGSASLVSGFFDINWSYRLPLSVNNSGNPSLLNQYQVKVVLDNSVTDFWNDIESDGRSIRMTDDDGSTLLDYFVDDFDYGGERSELYVEIPSIPASAFKTIYLYYGNSSTTSFSNGAATFLFYDDFESGDLGWQTYLSGSVAVVDDGGNGVLRKFNQSDANGGYRTFPASTGSFETLFRTKRVNFSGGGANRYAVSNSSISGYGPQLNSFDGSSTMLIEERNSGTAATISSTSSLSLSSNVWYTLSLRYHTGNIELAIYDAGGTQIDAISTTDGTVSSFDRFVVHGGYEFYTDDIRVRQYTSPDPSVNAGTVETTFSTSGPAISPTTGPAYSELLGFNHSTGASNQGMITYQISNDGVSWYWWNGSAWTPVSGPTDSNDIATVNDYVYQFVSDVGTGSFFFRAFFLSDGAQAVQLDGVELLYR
jgi:hypothetical protein